MPPESLPPVPEPQPIIRPRTVKQQSWSTVIAIAIIILMVIVGAFYTWGKRISEERAAVQQLTGTTTAP